MSDAAPPEPSLLPALALGSVGLLVLGVQPLLYADYIRAGLIVESRLGTLASVEISAIAIGSTIGIVLLRRLTPPIIGLAGLFLLVIGNLVYGGVPLFAGRAIAGLGGGLVVALAAAQIALRTNVNSASGLFLFLQATSQYALMQGLTILAPEVDAAGVQHVLAVIAVAAAPALLLVPRHLAAVSSDAPGSAPLLAGWIGLAACALFVGSAVAIWAYLGVWLQATGIPASSVSSRLTISLAGQILGSLCAVAMGMRIRSSRQVMASGAAMIAFVLLLQTFGPSGELGWMLLAGFGLAWMVATPALAGLLLELDPDRLSLPYGAAAQLLGAATIPTLVGEVMAASGPEHVLVGCATIAACALLVVLLGAALFAQRTVTRG